MKKLLMLAAAFAGIQASALAQTELSSFSVVGRGGVMNTFVHDFQAIGVNPGNLGRSTSIVSFTIGEGGVGASTQAMTRTTVNRFLEAAENKELTLAARRDLAKAFTSDNVLNAGADFNTFALSISLPKFGGLAISNRQRALSHVAFNKNFSELVFLGQDAELYKQYAPGQTVYVSQLFEGTEIKASWVNEWNIAYGRKIIDLPLLNIYGGAGYRYIQGMALYEFSSKGGEVKAYSAASPILDIDYDDYLNDPKFTYEDADGLLSPVGRGHGFDVGLSAEIVKIVKVSASVTDIGKMTWTENLLQAQDKGFKLPEVDGSEEYDFSEAADMAKTIIDSALVFSPVSELTTDLPTRFRAGVGVKIGEKVEVGLDYVRALNNAPGNISQDFVGLGIDVNPFSALRLSTGVTTGAGDKFNLPVGIAIVTPVYEFGVSTRDVTAPFVEDNPGGSFAVGFLRFKIGKPKVL
ncbi:DUF5723 family protein [Pontibacter cellulosilyticus]|uniref:DUF5723 domain-containing protein n=1 Tax=Pontibacter cellulosilyticus TaxID=1720253 RepID=A0A923N6J7_9BACT|nr:DUF5723 family protein [Pontibacter cellulosilyticus]MBC5993138.1 hypothetical protein [Pontibacter cellulosilyticus]